MSDSYKLTHWPQYPKGTTKIYSYLESRGGKFDNTLFFGLQAIVKKYLIGSIVTEKDVLDAQIFCKMHFGADLFNFDGWMYIVKELGGKLPLRIMAVPEGSLVPTGNVLMTIENTDPKCFWLTNYVETLLMKIWYPITVATNSFYCKSEILKSMKKTGSSTDGLPFKLHDFGYRGVSSEETSEIGGMAHLVNFMGTDTISAILAANEFYNNDEFKMYAYSVPASEHSTMTSWGKEHELDAIMNMLDSYPEGIVSVVADSFNVYKFAESLGEEPLRSRILSRKGTFVIRPDSGDPLEVNSKLIDILWNTFGGTYTDKGYKVLDPHIRILQGDGIDYEMIQQLLHLAESKKFSPDNWVYGSGGGLLQKFDRDTQKFAIKCSYAIINGSEVDVQKDPITSSSKKSKKGKLKLHQSGYHFSTISSATETEPMFNGYLDAMELVYENGELKREQSFDEIRDISNKYLERIS